MTKKNSNILMQIPEVRQEIEKHLWIESEKAGHDIGFDNATNDWIGKFSKGWKKENKTIFDSYSHTG